MSKSTHKLLLVKLFTLLLVATFALCACGPTECEHDYSNWKVKTNATCISTGEKQRTCTKCGDVQTETIDVVGHTEGTAVKENVVGATCGKDGSYDSVVYCSVCNTEISRTPQTTPKTNEHSFDEWHNEESATCIKDGRKGYNYCSACNKYFDESNTEIEDLIIPAHHEIEHHDAQKATCQQVGWEAYETCSRCDYTTYVEIPINYDHNFENGSCVDCGIELATGLSFKESKDETYYIVSGLGEETRTTFAIPSTHNGKPVSEIGTWAFENKNIVKVTIPSSVTILRSMAFAYCSSLISITIPSSVTYLGDGAFSGCSSLTSITIPGSVTYVRSHTFVSCYSLTSVTISDGVTHIFTLAFGSCKNLVEVTIPNSVIFIEQGAFEECTALTTINFVGTESEWNAIEKENLWAYYCDDTIGDSVQIDCTVNFIGVAE